MARAKRPAFDPASLPRYDLRPEDESRRRRELLTGLPIEESEAADPFEVRTDNFTGPLDLLIYLLREGEMEIEQLPILPIVEQYLSYLLTLNQELLDVNLAAESVSIIAQILDMKLKIKGLLHSEEEAEEAAVESDQPRLDLIAELMELQRLKKMTLQLAERFEEWQYRPGRPEDAAPPAPTIDTDRLIIPPDQIIKAFKAIVEQVNAHVSEATIPREEVTLEEQIAYVMAVTEREKEFAFHRLFDDIGHKEKIVVTFIAVLELTRQGQIVISQSEQQGIIWFESADHYRERLGLDAPVAEVDRELQAPSDAQGPVDPNAPVDANAPADGPARSTLARKNPFGAKGDDGAAGATDLADLFTGGEDDLDEEGLNMKQRIDAAVKIYHRVTAALDAYQSDGVILSATEAAERAGVENISVDKLKGERWWQKKKGDLALGDQVALGEQLAAELAGEAGGESAGDSGEKPVDGTDRTDAADAAREPASPDVGPTLQIKPPAAKPNPDGPAIRLTIQPPAPRVEPRAEEDSSNGANA